MQEWEAMLYKAILVVAPYANVGYASVWGDGCVCACFKPKDLHMACRCFTHKPNSPAFNYA